MGKTENGQIYISTRNQVTAGMKGIKLQSGESITKIFEQRMKEALAKTNYVYPPKTVKKLTYTSGANRIGKPTLAGQKQKAKEAKILLTNAVNKRLGISIKGIKLNEAKQLMNTKDSKIDDTIKSLASNYLVLKAPLLDKTKNKYDATVAYLYESNNVKFVNKNGGATPMANRIKNMQGITPLSIVKDEEYYVKKYSKNPSKNYHPKNVIQLKAYEKVFNKAYIPSGAKRGSYEYYTKKYQNTTSDKARPENDIARKAYFDTFGKTYVTSGKSNASRLTSFL